MFGCPSIAYLRCSTYPFSLQISSSEFRELKLLVDGSRQNILPLLCLRVLCTSLRAPLCADQCDLEEVQIFLPCTFEFEEEYKYIPSKDPYSIRTNMVALHFCDVTLSAKKPISEAYPKTLKTVGDHLRKRRLDLKLYQKDVAKAIGVDSLTSRNW